jgi:hypothetical protein
MSDGSHSGWRRRSASGKSSMPARMAAGGEREVIGAAASDAHHGPPGGRVGGALWRLPRTAGALPRQCHSAAVRAGPRAGAEMRK